MGTLLKLKGGECLMWEGVIWWAALGYCHVFCLFIFNTAMELVAKSYQSDGCPGYNDIYNNLVC